jgi:hypothetical protein
MIISLLDRTDGAMSGAAWRCTDRVLLEDVQFEYVQVDDFRSVIFRRDFVVDDLWADQSWVRRPVKSAAQSANEIRRCAHELRPIIEVSRAVRAGRRTAAGHARSARVNAPFTIDRKSASRPQSTISRGQPCRQTSMRIGSLVHGN